MADTSLFYWNERHGKTQPRFIQLYYRITAAKTVSSNPAGADSFSFFDAITQNQIDSYLGNTNDFLAAIFDSTAMGADTFGGIVRMSGYGSASYGQAAQVVAMTAFCYSGTGLSTTVSRAADGFAGLTASTLETAVGISTAGNIGFKVDFGNTPDFDALTSGLISIRIAYIAK
jgi:hypothetical protein